MRDTLIVPCSSCSTLNRVPTDRLGDVPVCSDCATRLLDGQIAQLTSSTFDRFVERSDLPVVVDFWAPWCGPCHTMAPQFEAAARTLAGRALLAKLDTEAHPDPAARFTIRSIPTLVVLTHGREVARSSGVMQGDQIVAWVEGQTGAASAGEQ